MEQLRQWRKTHKLKLFAFEYQVGRGVQSKRSNVQDEIPREIVLDI